VGCFHFGNHLDDLLGHDATNYRHGRRNLGKDQAQSFVTQGRVRQQFVTNPAKQFQVRFSALVAWISLVGGAEQSQMMYSTCSYSEDLELDDAVHTAILTLKEGFEGKMTADNIEIGICDQNGFQRLDPASIKDYLASIP